jgi:nucleotide-binding universal stress UspA family protein
MQKINRIIWALNPFDHAPNTTKRVVEFIKKVSKKDKVEVEPVFILQANSFFFKDQSALEFSRSVSQAAEERLLKLTKEVDLKEMLPPKVVLQEEWSISKSAKWMDDYAKATHSNLIIVGTHGRKRLARAVLGSFAETLLLNAHTPVLVISPFCKPLKKHSQVLFPTDFERGTALASEWTASIAKQLRGNVVLFHSLSNLL